MIRPPPRSTRTDHSFPTRRSSDLSDSAAPAHPLLFDLTDLVGHFQGQRLPNGIERVQIELTLAALEECGPRKVMLCSFLNRREAWVEIPSASFRDIVSLATSGRAVADPARQGACAQLDFHLHFADPLCPTRGALQLPQAPYR